MEKYCVSLKIARQLKKAGWKKKTEFWWNLSLIKKKKKEWFVADTRYDLTKELPAPLTIEILEELPYKINNIDYLVIRKCYLVDFYVEYWDYEKEPVVKIKADTLPNALALTWLYLKKEGLLKGV